MITAKLKPIPEIVAMAGRHARVLVTGCATCVAECAAGGQREVETIAPLLKMAVESAGGSLEVTTHTPEKSCDPEMVEAIAPLAKGVDAIVSLACGIGVQALADRFDPMPVYPGVNTTSLSIREEPGLWTARCAACGDCMLGETFGLCPVARCAKSLMNGPCGGTRSGGKCEVVEENDCIWVRIWQRAISRGAQESLAQVRPPRSWRASSHGGPARMLRKDLRP